MIPPDDVRPAFGDTPDSDGGARSETRLREQLLSVLRAEPRRLALIRILGRAGIPGAWLAAGAIRNAVWDHLHGRPARPPDGDLDVIWFDENRVSVETDRVLEWRISALTPGQDWSVKNQARMHRGNGDTPYRSLEDAMRHWPETATAVAVRPVEADLEILAPFGLGDLFALTIRPTPAFRYGKQHIVAQRIERKSWLKRWPRLTLVDLPRHPTHRQPPPFRDHRATIRGGTGGT